MSAASHLHRNLSQTVSFMSWFTEGGPKYIMGSRISAHYNKTTP